MYQSFPTQEYCASEQGGTILAPVPANRDPPGVKGLRAQGGQPAAWARGPREASLTSGARRPRGGSLASDPLAERKLDHVTFFFQNPTFSTFFLKKVT